MRNNIRQARNQKRPIWNFRERVEFMGWPTVTHYHPYPIPNPPPPYPLPILFVSLRRNGVSCSSPLNQAQHTACKLSFSFVVAIFCNIRSTLSCKYENDDGFCFLLCVCVCLCFRKTRFLRVSRAREAWKRKPVLSSKFANTNGVFQARIAFNTYP